MNLEEINNRINSDYYRTIPEAEADIIWLIAEVERTKTIETKYEEHLQQLDCPECGEVLTEVRPGKHQCDWCELTRENERLQTEVERLKGPHDLTILTAYDSGRQDAAQRCAEIAEQYSVDTPKGNMPVGRLIGKDIRKEFNP